jgi:hypothetical protein
MGIFFRIRPSSFRPLNFRYIILEELPWLFEYGDSEGYGDSKEV